MSDEHDGNYPTMDVLIWHYCEDDECPAPSRDIWCEDGYNPNTWGRERAARILAERTEAHRQEWHRG